MGDLGGIYYITTELFELRARLTGIVGKVPEGGALEIGEPEIVSQMRSKV
jgi:hypothetical protein